MCVSRRNDGGLYVTAKEPLRAVTPGQVSECGALVCVMCFFSHTVCSVLPRDGVLGRSLYCNGWTVARQINHTHLKLIIAH